MCTSTSSDTEISIIWDSGANVHMTLWKHDLANTRMVDRSCTFGNKGQLQALAMGEIPLHVSVHGKEAPAQVTLRDVLWVPGLPCRLLSTGSIRRDGGEFVDSGRKECYLRFRQDGPKIPLAESERFLTLLASLQGSGKHAASAHASFANKKQRLTLKQWHDTLGHIDPAAIKHLEKRGPILLILRWHPTCAAASARNASPRRSATAAGAGVPKYQVKSCTLTLKGLSTPMLRE